MIKFVLVQKYDARGDAKKLYFSNKELGFVGPIRHAMQFINYEDAEGVIINHLKKIGRKGIFQIEKIYVL